MYELTHKYETLRLRTACTSIWLRVIDDLFGIRCLDSRYPAHFIINVNYYHFEYGFKNQTYKKRFVHICVTIPPLVHDSDYKRI